VKSAPVLAARFGSHMAPSSSAVAEQPVLLQYYSQTIRDAYALLTLLRVRRLLSPMWLKETLWLSIPAGNQKGIISHAVHCRQTWTLPIQRPNLTHDHCLMLTLMIGLIALLSYLFIPSNSSRACRGDSSGHAQDIASTPFQGEAGSRNQEFDTDTSNREPTIP